IGKVKVGQSTSITCDAHPGEFFTGKVARIAAKGKTVSNVVTFEVKIEVVSKNKELLKPEMTTNVEIIVAEREDALLVPTEAIVRRLRGQPTVVVLNDDGTTESRAIETGMTDGFRTEVASGVEEGETVVVRRGEGEGRWRGRGGMTGSGGPSSMGGSSRGGPPMMFGGGGPPRR
ncbi:efflux RND transporter periplasmic adaptor subunit, partial [Candidatus Sumerlaeota bacterium]|nr:efflux RND transporter periplasmic adaptor subunit [Candidatus Sumerlaeota bacterium]